MPECVIKIRSLSTALTTWCGSFYFPQVRKVLPPSFDKLRQIQTRLLFDSVVVIIIIRVENACMTDPTPGRSTRQKIPACITYRRENLPNTYTLRERREFFSLSLDNFLYSCQVHLLSSTAAAATPETLNWGCPVSAEYIQSSQLFNI